MTTIVSHRTRDLRVPLPDGAGSDAVHLDPQYGYAVTLLHTDRGLVGTGITYTLGDGTDLICHAIDQLIQPVLGQDIDELMARFGEVQRGIAEHHRLRWLGPHKGVIHAALASITNACFDLWAKHRGVPLWRLLLDLSPAEFAALIDFSYLDEVLNREDAVRIIEAQWSSRPARASLLDQGYPGYDTSVGWFRYDDKRLRDNAKRALDAGFTAMKLKVGGPEPDRDIRRVALVREAVGDTAKIMLDANQAWSLPRALEMASRLRDLAPEWLEEPTQPDDIHAHRELAEAIAPIDIAVGESIHNRVVWKNFLAANAVHVVQADCTRLAGISEYLAVALLATQFPVRVVPHVGDMGQIHQHLVLVNHIALGHDVHFLEYIPHLRDYFRFPAEVHHGRYRVPHDAGASSELLDQ
ncbi:MAG: enolase C-terminal domain-like protein [Pseudomonadota bacterium]